MSIKNKEIQNNKSILRNTAKELRLKQDCVFSSLKIIENIKKIGFFKTSKSVMIFYPLKYEPNLLPLRTEFATTKKFIFPKIENEKIVPYLDSGNFKIGKFNVFEPDNDLRFDLEKIDLIIVPALANDKKGNRLGYGKGYYDRFLKEIKNNNTTILSVNYDDLIFKEIPTEKTDKKIDILITETKTITINSACKSF